MRSTECCTGDRCHTEIQTDEDIWQNEELRTDITEQEEITSLWSVEASSHLVIVIRYYKSHNQIMQV